MAVREYVVFEPKEDFTASPNGYSPFRYLAGEKYDLFIGLAEEWEKAGYGKIVATFQAVPIPENMTQVDPGHTPKKEYASSPDQGAVIASPGVESVEALPEEPAAPKRRRKAGD
ncbi:MAG: hypothetical protein ACRCYS_15100 [Beijerinckiaceae bacterium]